jgi:hypothetical protein
MQLASAPHNECKNTRHRDTATTCTYRRTLGCMSTIPACIFKKQYLSLPLVTHNVNDNFIWFKGD